jgi:membrane-bound lytic murein transglycosylase D
LHLSQFSSHHEETKNHQKKSLMIQLHKRYFVLLAVILSSSFLSACSGLQSSPPSSSLHTKDAISPVTAKEEYPDLVPVSTEPETCLQKELDALRRTGTWESGERLVGDDKSGRKVQYDFPVTMNKQVEMYIDFFQNEHRKLFAGWLNRSSMYLPMMQQELKSAGLPLDLAYLSMIESGFNQRACSTAQAIGLWQFMAETGKQYSLRIDSYVDERRDAEKSTKAAVAMLGDLYHEFGDWNLAVAAYNAGSGRIGTGLKKYNVNTFWDLAKEQHLSLETIRYVPQLMAAIIIAKDPERFGFVDIKPSAPPTYETLVVGPGMGFDGLALITNSSKEEIQALNMELIAGKTPLTDRKYEVKIPTGTRTLALNNLPRLRTVVTTDFRSHVIGHHESLASICKRYDVSRTALLKANTVKNNRFVAGITLRIPINAVHYQLASDKTEAIAQVDTSKSPGKPAAKETASKAGEQRLVQPETMIAINSLKNEKKLQAGQISAPAGKKEKVSRSSASPVKPATIKENKQTDKARVLTAQKKAQPVKAAKEEFKYYHIANGDSLWAISQKFKTSPDQIKSWNNLKSNDLHPGDKIKVKDASPVIAERVRSTL